MFTGAPDATSSSDKNTTLWLLRGWVANHPVLFFHYTGFKHPAPRQTIGLTFSWAFHGQKWLITASFLLSSGADGSICVKGFSRGLGKVWKAFESLHSTWYKRLLKCRSLLFYVELWAVNMDVFPLSTVLFVLQWRCRPISVSFLCIYLCWWWFIWRGLSLYCQWLNDENQSFRICRRKEALDRHGWNALANPSF